MKMKKMMQSVAVLLIVLMMSWSLAACGDTADAKKEDWLPYGLQFGQTYDEFVQVFEENHLEAPGLKPADANDGYLTDWVDFGDSSESPFDWSFLHSDALVQVTGDPYIDYIMANTLSNSMVSFSFNQDKKLYEMYCSFIDDDKKLVEKITPEIIAYYNEKAGFDGRQNADSITDSIIVIANWETDEWVASILYDASILDDYGILTIMLHSVTYDLTTAKT